MLNKKSVDDINVKGKRVLVRCDFNVPLIDGKITDENRLVAALPTIKKLVADGGKIILHYSWGETAERSCRFIDEYHTEVGSNLYHICEFAERMQKNGATYEPKPAEQTPQKTPKHKDLER